MKINSATVRVKLIMAFFASAAMAGICILLLCIILVIASANLEFAKFFYNHFIAFLLAFFAIFTLLIVFFFLLLIKNKIKYLEEITKTLEVISSGNLEISIPVKTSDELGKMAKTVNEMAHKLKGAIEEERRLEKIKNDLITNISHDLRTPLTSTLGYLELIKNMKLDDEERLKRYISISYSKCKDLKILIDHLFEYSKLNNTEMIINKKRISMGELIEQVIMGFIPAFTEAGMEYRLFFADEKLIVNADPVLMTRVFDNLINNAVNYGKEGKYVDIELQRESDEVLVRIISYGKTISDADLPYIFEKFYQVDKWGSTRSGSSGLGLAIVKRIIEMHNGSISASSLDNRTVFEIRLMNEK